MDATTAAIIATVLVVLSGYFLPTIVAKSRKHHNTMPDLPTQPVPRLDRSRLARRADMVDDAAAKGSELKSTTAETIVARRCVTAPAMRTLLAADR